MSRSVSEDESDSEYVPDEENSDESVGDLIEDAAEMVAMRDLVADNSISVSERRNRSI
jgi:hypothetical protein